MSLVVDLEDEMCLHDHERKMIMEGAPVEKDQGDGALRRLAPPVDNDPDEGTQPLEMPMGRRGTVAPSATRPTLGAEAARSGGQRSAEQQSVSGRSRATSDERNDVERPWQGGPGIDGDDVDGWTYRRQRTSDLPDPNRTVDTRYPGRVMISLGNPPGYGEDAWVDRTLRAAEIVRARRRADG